MQLVHLFSLFSGVMNMGSCSPSSSDSNTSSPVEETSPLPEEEEEELEEEELEEVDLAEIGMEAYPDFKK